jgi:hypothetical protein
LEGLRERVTKQNEGNQGLLILSIEEALPLVHFAGKVDFGSLKRFASGKSFLKEVPKHSPEQVSRAQWC